MTGNPIELPFWYFICPTVALCNVLRVATTMETERRLLEDVAFNVVNYPISWTGIQ